MAGQRFNVGVIGYGMSAKVFHIPLIKYVEGFNLHAILQRTPRDGDDASKDYPNVKCYRKLEDLLDDKDIDLVVVTSTPETHYNITEAALRAGKHVVVEKPFAPTSKECFDLVEQAKSAGKLLTVYQNRRWDSDFLTLKQVISEKSLGRIAEFETHYDRYRLDPPTTWKGKAISGGGVIYDLGSHLIDQVIYLFGTPSKVTGLVYAQREGGPDDFDDSCTVLLQYPGMLVTVKASVISPETEQLRYWVRGTKGSFRKTGLDTQEDALKARKMPDAPEFGLEPENQYGALTTVTASGDFTKSTYPPLGRGTYDAFYSQLFVALSGHAPVPVDPGTAAQVIKVIEIAKQSSKEGRTLEFT